MKNLRTLIVTVIAVLASVCCTREEIEHDDYLVRLSVSTSDIELTRATKPGEDDLNENLIKSIDYFLFSEEGSLLKSGRINVNAIQRTGVEITLASGEFNQFFPSNGDKCNIYLIANLPEAVKTTASTTLDDLKAISITTDFTSQSIQKSFVMNSGNTLSEVQRTGTSASGEVQLHRVASKLTMEIGVADIFIEDKGTEDTTDDIEWTPSPSNMKIELKKVAEKTNVNGDTAAADSIGNYGKKNAVRRLDESGSPVTYTAGTESFGKYDVTDGYWYSYPRDWSSAPDESLSFLITLPWTREEGGSSIVQKCYYKILLSGSKVNPDTWYHINAELKVLGSFYEDEPTLILPDNLQYYAVPWKDGIGDGDYNTDAYIKDARYLTISQKSYIMDNVNTLSIPFSSSHECEAEVVSAKYYRYSGATVEEDDLLPSGDPDIDEDNPGGYTLTWDDTKVTLTYNLQNNIAVTDLGQGTFDFVEYRYTIKLHHSEEPYDAEYTETITVSQRPALVLTAEENTRDGYKDVHTVFVNSNNTYQSGGAGWFSTTGRNRSGASSSPYMYIATASKSDDYIIGDPRSTVAKTGAQIGMGGADTQANVHNATNPVSATAPAFYIEEEGHGNYYSTPNTSHIRKLTYYYQTNDGDAYKNMIAPSFRISSANSQLNLSLVSKQQFIWRCATYQEFGYPAGRWRLPTYAELRFMAKLSSAGLINTMFTSGTSYWSADGLYSYSSNGEFEPDNDNRGYGRCIYDEWYWSQSKYATLPDKEVFTWGDMPRENFK